MTRRRYDAALFDDDGRLAIFHLAVYILSFTIRRQEVGWLAAPPPVDGQPIPFGASISAAATRRIERKQMGGAISAIYSRHINSLSNSFANAARR